VSGDGLPEEALWLRRQVRDLAGWHDMTSRVAAEIGAAVAEIRGPAAAAELRRLGLERLHEVIDARDIAALRDRVLGRLRQPLLKMAVAVGRDFIGWSGDFFVDDYLILRINFPYEVARRADPAAENPGLGRLSESVRALFQARKTIDPLYDPRSYHRGHPPAAWVHGPHRDSWVGHSREGRNVWWAIGDVPAEAGFVRYPSLTGVNLPRDPRTLCLRDGYPLPKPDGLSLRAGEMLVFDPEVLHGTHLNTSGVTRVVVTMRLDAGPPAFDPGCFYAFEFWRRAHDIEQGRDVVLHLRREEHLSPMVEVTPDPPRGALPLGQGTFDPTSGIWRGRLEGETEPARRGIVTAGGRRVLVARTDDGLRAYDAACPHYGRDLADGGSDGDTLYCPACGVRFDLRTGTSGCPSLTLHALRVWESDGILHVKLDP
jgi:nitrite reductase/ring-hydroxylating ferredoxin subunit